MVPSNLAEGCCAALCFLQVDVQLPKPHHKAFMLLSQRHPAGRCSDLLHERAPVLGRLHATGSLSCAEACRAAHVSTKILHHVFCISIPRGHCAIDSECTPIHLSQASTCAKVRHSDDMCCAAPRRAKIGTRRSHRAWQASSASSSARRLSKSIVKACSCA